MSLNPELLTGLDYEDILARGIKGGELVEYSIFSNLSPVKGQDTILTIGYNNHIINTFDHDDNHKIFIRSVFERLDPLLDLDFVEADSSGSSNINIYRAWRNSWWDARESELASNHMIGGTTHYNEESVDIAWQDNNSSDQFDDEEKMSIVHEIGHALGLIDLGFDSRWDHYDSIMSYNRRDGLPPNTWFSESDIKAIQSIWGVEDNKSPMHNDSPLPAKEELVLEIEKTQVPVNKRRADKLRKISDDDGVVNFHIDVDGSYKKKSRKFSTSHKDFIEGFLGEISRATGLNIYYVDQRQADVLIHSTGGKLDINLGKNLFNVNLGKAAKKRLNEKRKEDISGYILYSFGLDDIPRRVDHSGDDSLMSWHYAENGYAGLTSADITSLQSLW